MLPSNAQTSWLDLSPVTTAAMNERVRTRQGGLLSTDVARWPLAEGSIEQLIVADLFVREHNREARLLAAALPNTTSDEELFQRAREHTIATLQHITTKEWLPTLTGDELPAYKAASDEVDNDNELLSGTTFRQYVVTSADGHKADLRGDVSVTFALACAPALRLASVRGRQPVAVQRRARAAARA